MEFFAGNGAVALLRTAVSLIAAAVVTCAAVAAPVWSPFLWGIPLVAAVWAASVFWHIPRFKRSVWGTFDGGNVRIAYGVFWQREIYVPLSALRTFEIWAPPLHRLFRCRTVVLRFAGGAALLPLLGCDTAAALTEALDHSEEES